MTSYVTDEIIEAARQFGLDARPFYEMSRVPRQLQGAVQAHMLGVSQKQLSQAMSRIRAQVDLTAGGLASKPSVAAQLAALPFASGERVVVLGDSLSADALGWVSLLSSALNARDGRIDVINRSVSGRTTSETVAHFAPVVELQPDWVLIMLGTNDVRRHGSTVRARMLSLEESIRNLQLLAALAKEETGARVIVITPPPINSAGDSGERSADMPGLYWVSEEMANYVAAILQSTLPVVDIFHSVDTSGEFWIGDGIHLTFEGQQAMFLAMLPGLGRLPAEVGH